MKKIGFLEKLLGKSSEDDEGDLHGLNKSAQEMIEGIHELSGTTVKEVMLPRIDVVFISIDSQVKELLNTIVDSGHSRFPVYHETLDNVVGILYAKDMLHSMVKGKGEPEIEKMIRPAYFIPESKKLNSLLREFQRRHVHIAVVVDEYGGTSGIVSLEDIFEEIVGEIQDEFDNETEEILKISEGVFLCDGRASLEDLNSEFGLNLPEDDFDSLGGFVFDLFGKIPVKYEKMTYKEIDFIIHHMEGHKILTVKIVVHKKEGKKK